MRRCLGLLFLLGIPAQASTNGSSGVLRLRISGIRESESAEIAYALFNRKDGFPGKKDQAFRRGFLPSLPRSKDGLLDLAINDVPYGNYAVSVYLDVNGDRTLNKNFLGIPTEPAGASRNPRNLLGPPRFEDCRIEFVSSELVVPIALVR